MPKAKPKMGRPKLNRPIRKIAVTPYFDEEHDADLLKIIDAAPEGKKWATMKAMMRGGVSNFITTDEEEDLDLSDMLNF